MHRDGQDCSCVHACTGSSHGNVWETIDGNIRYNKYDECCYDNRKLPEAKQHYAVVQKEACTYTAAHARTLMIAYKVGRVHIFAWTLVGASQSQQKMYHLLGMEIEVTPSSSLGVGFLRPKSCQCLRMMKWCKYIFLCHGDGRIWANVTWLDSTWVSFS